MGGGGGGGTCSLGVIVIKWGGGGRLSHFNHNCPLYYYPSRAGRIGPSCKIVYMHTFPPIPDIAIFGTFLAHLENPTPPYIHGELKGTNPQTFRGPSEIQGRCYGGWGGGDFFYHFLGTIGKNNIYICTIQGRIITTPSDLGPASPSFRVTTEVKGGSHWGVRDASFFFFHFWHIRKKKHMHIKFKEG